MVATMRGGSATRAERWWREASTWRLPHGAGICCVMPRATTPPPAWLLGRWRLVHAAASLGFTPGTCMEFRDGGHLRYTIPVDGLEQDIKLVYQVDGDVLRTENPLSPRATATPFRQGPGDTLVLDFADSPAVLVRELRDRR
jgi:hypothetical protein